MPRGSSKKFFLFGLPGGGGVSGSQVIFTDVFTAANGTNLNGRTTTTGNKTWVVTGVAGFDIQSNQAHSTSAGGDGFASVDAGVSNVTFLITFAGAAGTGGICWRRSDDNNHWLVQAGGGAAHIYKRVAGSYTDLGSIGVTPVQNDVLKVIASGNSHSVYDNNTLAITLTDSFNNTATQVGIKGFATNQSFDNAQANT